MATTVSFTASMRTRKTSDSSNYKSSAASQEFYTSGTNFVGIVHFSGLSLLNKVIIGMTLRVTSAEAGFGAGTTKTVYLRKSKYQAASQSGITGGNYYGDALGTYTGSFYGNTTSYDFSGALFYSVADYLQAGNNTFCLYNPSPSASGQGYSYNYFQWSVATLFVTYRGGIWSPKRVLDMLKNEKYAGNALPPKKVCRRSSDPRLRKSITGSYQSISPKALIRPSYRQKCSFGYKNEMERNRIRNGIERKAPQYTAFTGMICCGKCGKKYRRKVSRTETAWNCGTFLVYGKKHCHTKQIPEEILMNTTASVLGLTEFDEAVFKERVQEIRVPAFNHLVYVFKDGTEETRVWQDKSRRDSWDESMRQQAAEHAKREICTMSEARVITPRVTMVPATLNRFTAMPIINTHKRRVAAYARVSTNSEEQQTSYATQVSYYTEYIQSNAAWEFVDVYADADAPYGLNPKSP